MKKIWVLCCLALLFGRAFTQTVITGGDVSGTWTASNSPYHIQGDVSIPNNEVLRIDPGVTVIFKGHYRIATFNADLIAVGKPDSMIVFTMDPSDTTGLALGGEDEGGWNGLRFFYSSESGDTSRLEYCRFEYCKVHDNVSGGRGVIGTERIPRLLVANCVFQYNYSDISGVDCRLADVVIRDNLFQHNTGNYLVATSQANPSFIRNEVRDNTMERMFSISSWCFPVIEENLIRDNSVKSILYSSGEKSSPVFINNRVVNNQIASGYYLLDLNSSEARVSNNLIANNDGRGINIYFGNNILQYNTVVNNDNLGSYLMQVRTEQGEFNGNIFHGNNGSVYYDLEDSEPAFKYNLIEGGIGGFTGDAFAGVDIGNIDQDPEFIDPTLSAGTAGDGELADFGLKRISPVINKGDPSLDNENYTDSDIYGNLRVKYSYIDMGAAEASIDTLSIAGTITSDTTLIGDTIKVTGDITVNDDVTLTIAGGARVIFQGPFRIDVDGTLITAGTVNDTILFTVADTAGFGGTDYSQGCWKGIYLNNGSGTMDDNTPTSLNYCIFEYGKTDNDYVGGILSLISVDGFSAKHCIFRYNKTSHQAAVLYADNADFSFEHCRVSHNTSRDVNYAKGALAIFNSTARISGCVFDNNVAADGAALYISGTTLYSSGNLYRNNTNFNYSGGGIALTASNSECYLVNDVIVNNNSGNAGALDFSSCIATITNSTIANNKTDNSYFAGAIGLTRTNLQLYNTILYGNLAGSYPYSIFLFEENTDPDLYNCLVEGGLGGVRTYSGFTFSGDFEDCFAGNPYFVRPTMSAGNGEDASGTDWQLLDVSPCINTGTTDTTGLNLPGTDAAGNQRILNGRIEVGAYEKGGTKAEIYQDPQGGNLCTGEDHSLQIEYTGTDSVFIQWRKDGINVPGANSALLEIQDAVLADEGNYTCFLWNAFGIVKSTPVFISVKSPPEILSEPVDSWVEPDKPLSLEMLVTGSSPLLYQWQRNGEDIPGAHLPELRFIPSDTSHEGSYRGIVTNVCGSDSTASSYLYLAPQICMVTVDSVSGNNLIVWEKNTTAPLIAYNVYRESAAAGIYDLLGTVPFDELSVFSDSTADPTVQAYIYKITGIDTAETETDADLCRRHKTIHLLVSTNPELHTTQLEWDRYYGFLYQTYYIFRSTTGTNFEQVHSIASTLSSWTDPDPVEGDLYYRITVRRQALCYPTGTGLKASAGPYSHSLSNLDDNKLQGTGTGALKTASLKVFPNPFGTVATVEFPNPERSEYRMVLRDLAGKVVMTINGIRDSRFVIHGEKLAKGSYILELQGEKTYRDRIILE